MNDRPAISGDIVEDEADSAATILDRAARRRIELDLPFAGAVTPPEAWQLVQQGAAQLVDVRTAAEFRFVGHVPGTVNVEWHGRDELPRREFLRRLSAAAAADDVVLLICRSGVRSYAACIAAAASGRQRAYNVSEGFEGEIDANRQRGKINGWRWHQLPWAQD